jgi:MerR family transcriptional regulator, mercuric resistance operon regulatory protein
VRLGETPNCRDAKTLAARKLHLVESRLEDLRRMQSALRSLVSQCENGRERSCLIIEVLSN